MSSEAEEQRLVFLIKPFPVLLVQNLNDPDELLAATDQGHGQNRAGPVTRLFIEFPIKTRIGVNMGDVFDGPGSRHRPGDALTGWEADLVDLQLVGRFAPQLIAPWVVEE